jgi:CheY-like chemotaxis protein
MPVMGGVEATQYIRFQEQQRGAGQHIPIIALTAHATEAHRAEYIDAGMDEHITKPIDRKKLEQVLLILMQERNFLLHQQAQ